MVVDPLITKLHGIGVGLGSGVREGVGATLCEGVGVGVTVGAGEGVGLDAGTLLCRVELPDNNC